MADRNKTVPGNVPGNFFVDTTCINCDNCRILAPETFGYCGDYAGVKRQPETAEEVRRAVQALICCPTGSIGTLEKNDAREVMEDFPMRMDGDVYYLGFNSPRSAGGKSYVVLSPAGNWFIDAPKFVPRLVNWLAERGGLKYIFLTHRDDCADAAKFAARFGAKRIIHRGDLAAQPDAEIVVDGEGPLTIEPGVVVVPTPGHTLGHCMLVWHDRYLFSGDVFTNSLYGKQGLVAYDAHWCWYSYEMQTESIEKLKQYTFEWVFPGHGRFTHAPADEMQAQLARAIEWCRQDDPEPVTPKRLANLEMYAAFMRELGMPEDAREYDARISALKAKLGAG